MANYRNGSSSCAVIPTISWSYDEHEEVICQNKTTIYQMTYAKRWLLFLTFKNLYKFAFSTFSLQQYWWEACCCTLYSTWWCRGKKEVRNKGWPVIGFVFSADSWFFPPLQKTVLFGLILFIPSSTRKLYIADARPRKNALANSAMGGGSESSSNYFQSEVCLRFENYINASLGE